MTNEPEQDPRIPCPRCKGSGFVPEPDMTADEVSDELERRGIDIGPAWAKVKAALDKARGPQAQPGHPVAPDAPSTRAAHEDATSEATDALADKLLGCSNRLLVHPAFDRIDRDIFETMRKGAEEIRRLRSEARDAEDEIRALRSELEAARKGDHDRDGSLVYRLDRAADSAPLFGDLMRQAAREIEGRRARVAELESENGALKDQVEDLEQELDECRAMDDDDEDDT